MASLIRELRLDHATGQLVSHPIAEYSNLHTQAFVDKQLISLPPFNGSATTLQIPHGQGGALDSKPSAALRFPAIIPSSDRLMCVRIVEVSFDLSSLAGSSNGEFGVALRSSNSSLSAALTLYFNTSGPDADGTWMVSVRTTQHLRPSVPPAPLPLLPVLKGEQLTVRALIDRALMRITHPI